MIVKYSKLTFLNVRRMFDPSDKKDCDELKYFIANTKWKSLCPFLLEDPYHDIPTMCKEKFTKHVLGVK